MCHTRSMIPKIPLSQPLTKLPTQLFSPQFCSLRKCTYATQTQKVKYFLVLSDQRCYFPSLLFEQHILFSFESPRKEQGMRKRSLMLSRWVRSLGHIYRQSLFDWLNAEVFYPLLSFIPVFWNVRYSIRTRK